MWRNGQELNSLFITVCLLCLVLLPSFPTIQILPFSLYHLSDAEVRMSMTQQGHCFVILFYLFLDNEKSAEGLAWCFLPPMKLFLGHMACLQGATWLFWLCGTGSTLLISFLQRIVMNSHHHASWLKQNDFFLVVYVLDILSFSCRCFTVIDRWLDCRKAAAAAAAKAKALRKSLRHEMTTMGTCCEI